MLAMILAVALGSSPAEQAKALHEELLAPVRQCMAGAGPSDACLRSAHDQCVARITNGKSSDPMVESFCASVENEGWEAERLDAESKLDAALSKGKEADILANVQASRKAWETYRDEWCEAESRTVPTALTGESDLARETCRKALTQDRLARTRRMIEWQNP